MYRISLLPLLLAVLALIAQPLPLTAKAQAAPAQQKPVNYYDTSWSFNDVDVAKLTRRLSRIGVTLPVELSGQISGTLSVGIPLNKLTHGKAWKFGGVLRAPQFSVNKIALSDVTIEINYRDGELLLEKLNVGVPDGKQQPVDANGRLAGTARMQLIPRGVFTASLALTDFQVGALSAEFKEFSAMQGRLTGKLVAKAPADELQSITSWEVEAPVKLKDFSFDDSSDSKTPVAAVEANFELSDGILSADHFLATLGQTTAEGKAKLQLDQSKSWNAAAQLKSTDFLSFLEVVNSFIDSPELVAVANQASVGAVQTAVKINGNVHKPANLNIAGHASLSMIEFNLTEQLQIQAPLKPLTIDELEFDYQLGKNTLVVDALSAKVLGGSITGDATVPLRGGEMKAELQWSELNLGKLLAAPIETAGISSGGLNIAIPANAFQTPEKWELGAHFSLTELASQEFTLRNLKSGSIKLQQGRLTIPDFSASFNGKRSTLNLDMLLGAPHSISLTLNVPKLQLALLKRIPQIADYADRIQGEAGINGKLSGTWQPLELKGAGQVVGSDITVDGINIDSLKFDFNATKADFSLSSLNMLLYGGKVTGNANLQYGNQLGGTAKLSWNDVNLSRFNAGQLFEASELAPIHFDGTTNGSIQLTIPPGAVNRRAAWTAELALEAPQVSVYDWQLTDIAPISVWLKEGQLVVSELKASLDKQPLSASGELSIESPYRLKGQLNIEQFPLDRLSALPQFKRLQGQVGGLVECAASIEATLATGEFSADAQVVASQLRFRDQTIESVRFSARVTPQAIALSAVEAKAFGGSLSGKGIIPLAENASGSATLHWTKIGVGSLLSESFTSIGKLQGSTSGNLQLTIPPASLRQPSRWDFSADVELPDLRSNGVAIAELSASADQQAGNLRYQASGELFQGALNVSGQRDVKDENSAGLALLGSVQATLQKAELSAITVLFAAAPTALPPISGELSLDVESNASSTGIDWGGNAQLSSLKIANKSISPSAELQFNGNEQSVRLTNLTGQFAGGKLAASGEWFFWRQRSGSIRVRVRDAELERIASLAGGGNLPLKGRGDLELRISPGANWRFRGKLGLPRAELAGTTIRNARLPIEGSWHPASGRLRTRLSSLHASIAGGRVTGRLTASRSVRWRLDGKLRFYRVNFTRLTGSNYGQGSLSGTLDISGRNVRSINDLQATLLADLKQTQMAKIPILTQMSNYVPGLSSGATRFNDGRIEAYLNRGVIRIDKLRLASSRLQMFIDGQITLAGRLHLEAIVSTGNISDTVQARVLLSRLALSTVAPVSLLASANDLLSDRVIHLAISGTLDRPSIRLLPVKLLREEAIRFFLRQATGVALPTAGATAVSGSR